MAMQLSVETFGILASYKGYFFLLQKIKNSLSVYFLLDQASWCLKTRALTEQVYVDEVDVDEEGIAEMLMDDNAVAQLPRQ